MVDKCECGCIISEKYIICEMCGRENKKGKPITQKHSISPQLNDTKLKSPFRKIKSKTKKEKKFKNPLRSYGASRINIG